jgi:hypothetical protein
MHSFSNGGPSTAKVFYAALAEMQMTLAAIPTEGSDGPEANALRAYLIDIGVNAEDMSSMMRKYAGSDRSEWPVVMEYDGRSMMGTLISARGSFKLPLCVMPTGSHWPNANRE